MRSPRPDRRHRYSLATWLALFALPPASLYLGITVRPIFLLPGLFAALCLGLGLFYRRRD